MFLPRVFSPVCVAPAPSDANRMMMRCPNGEIRVYGLSTHRESRSAADAVPVVMKSTDLGRNWITEPVQTPHPGALVQSPWSGKWITVLSLVEAAEQKLHAGKEVSGTVRITADSPDGPFYYQEIFPEQLHIQRQPLALQQTKCWIVPFQWRGADLRTQWGVLRSDDDGNTWERIDCVPPPFPPECLPGHHGSRWRYCGLEPVVAEYPDGSLHALLRCANDMHYESVSADAGKTWSDPVPSIFFAVATMPGLYRLSGDRILAVWNNTVPLPEEDHRNQYGSDDNVIQGTWEDYFTNRDVLHAAISLDSGKTWRGFRELLLNPARNDGDFRSVFFPFDTHDKSVHQNQVLELEDGTVLVHCGQNAVSRKLLLFHPDWLEETSTEEDFMFGLDHVSTHLFLKSTAGGYRGTGTGHCSLNRRPGAALVPHPDRFDREALLLGRHPDDRLVSDREGIVWNFPMGKTGKVTVHFRMNQGTAGCHVRLMDRWANPSDESAETYAAFSLKLGSGIVPDVWHELVIAFDTDKGTGTAQIDGALYADLPQLRPTRIGMSYLHLQTAAETADSCGVLFEKFQAEIPDRKNEK